jgi:ubiquinone/menaquinone biosynthesis C-methylase UbiE
MLLEELENTIKLYCVWRASRKKRILIDVKDVKWIFKLTPKKILKFYLKDIKEYSRIQQIELDHLQMLVKKLRSNEKVTVLDAGCGYGRYLQRLLKYATNDQLMVGVDVKRTNLIYGKTICQRCSYLNVDIRKMLPFQDCTFDIVICTLVLHQTQRKRGLQMTINEFSRVLRKDGLLYMVDFTSKNKLQTLLMQYLQAVVPEVGRYYHEQHIVETLKVEGFMLVSKEKVIAHRARDVYAFVAQKNR